MGRACYVTGRLLLPACTKDRQHRGETGQLLPIRPAGQPSYGRFNSPQSRRRSSWTVTLLPASLPGGARARVPSAGPCINAAAACSVSPRGVTRAVREAAGAGGKNEHAGGHGGGANGQG